MKGWGLSLSRGNCGNVFYQSSCSKRRLKLVPWSTMTVRAATDLRFLHGESKKQDNKLLPICSVLQPSSIRGLATPWTYFLHLSLSSVILIDTSTESPVHVLMLSIQAVRGLPLAHNTHGPVPERQNQSGFH